MTEMMICFGEIYLLKAIGSLFDFSNEMQIN